MNLDLNRLKGIDSGTQESKRDSVHFEVGPNSFFTILVFDNVLRGPELGTMGLIGGNSAVLPEPLSASSNQLVIEKVHSSEPFDLLVRDGKTGFVFFNIEGNLYEYDAAAHLLRIEGGRLLVSEELANKLGRPADAGLIVGEISIATTIYPIEVTTFVNGAAKSLTLPSRAGGAPSAPEGSVPGPDIVVGDMSGLQQFGSSAGQVGLATGATSCNNGDQPFHFYQLPDPDHSVVSQNLYRMSGGSSNNDRFEQIGQAWVKHTFGASQEDACGFGCTPFPDQSELGVGCSDPYSASQNGFQGNTNNGALGSRAWVNPFTGFFPVSPRPENHTGHTHTGTSHRILVNGTDLNTTMNAGATYYLEVQYDSPHEYAWCQAHPGQCNMYNNASHRRYNVAGTTSFTFAAVGSTVRMTPATGAWTGATSSTIEPEPGVDGRAFVVYKVTGPVAGVWHYEYAIHNQNLDRSIQSFSVPLGVGITLSNLGFHAPPNHPGFPNDGTQGNAGFSNTAWTSNQTADALSWSTETFAQNQNANAVRFGTLYNFRFDSDRPPQAVNATIGFFKTGTPITVEIQGPSPDGGVTPTPTPTPSTPTPTPTPTATATPTPLVSISGTVLYCLNPVPGPVPNVTLTLTGSASGSTLSNASGNYTFPSLPSGGNYTVTPSKAARAPGSANINTVDVIAVQRHFLVMGPPLTKCKLLAADVDLNSLVNTVDVIAVQRFFLDLTTGIAQTGKYKFTPVSRSYMGLVSNQTAQDYDTLVYGDAASGFVELVEGESPTAAANGTSVSTLSGRDTSAVEVAATVAAVALPEVAVDASVTDFIVQATTTTINAGDKLVGFQGDLTFDERVVTFESEPVQKAGITGGNWNVSGNVLAGPGPIRTLRLSAFSNDFTPLSGSGTLFELRMTRVSTAAQGTPLLWAAPPDHFIFIDADLKTQKPGYAAPGSVTGKVNGDR